MSTQTLLSQLSAELAATVARVGASVVTVRSGQGASSATLLRPGYLVASHHGLDPDADRAQILVGPALHDARVVGRDPGTDLAVLQVDLADLPVAAVGDMPPVGAYVVSVGRAWDRLVSSFGVVHAVTGPMTRRHGGRIETLIRTTIAPYPGFSGGALVDASGRVVGISTAGLQRGAGVALPMALVERTLEALVAHGHIRRGFVGVTTMPVEMAPSQRGPRGESGGLLVTSISPDGPSGRAGVLVGDILVAMAGRTVATVDDLMSFLTGDVVGQQVPATVMRGTQAVSLAVTVGERGPS